MASDTFAPESAPSRTRHRRDWRDGGRTVKPWDEGVLAIALVALGVALLIAAAIRGFDPGATASTVAGIVVLVGMLVAVAIAFVRAKPRPLLKLRAIDVLYGLAFGLLLRVVQGWLAVAAGESGALPSYAASQQALGTVWLFVDVGTLVLVAPIVEALFFHGVLLVTAYSVVRRIAGRTPAFYTALVLSTVAFIATHVWTSGTSWEAWATPLVVGASCALLVLFTGRIWGAVFVHFVFHATFAALAAMGTLWG